MNAKTISFNSPCRDVRLNRVLPISAFREESWQEELRASYERGRQDGEKALSEQLLKQRADLLNLQNGVLASLQSVLPQVVRDCEKALIQLALEVAQKLVSNIPVSGEMVEAAVREALSQADQSGRFVIHVHSDDLALLKAANSPLISEEARKELMQFQASDEVGRGGCWIDTRFGVVDASRETKLELIQNALAS